MNRENQEQKEEITAGREKLEGTTPPRPKPLSKKTSMPRGWHVKELHVTKEMEKKD